MRLWIYSTVIGILIGAPANGGITRGVLAVEWGRWG